MKDGIHPVYRPIIVRDAATGKEFLTRSAVRAEALLESDDGSRYPVMVVEVTADSHPFWTGAQRVMDTAGRVEKFERRYGTRVLPPRQAPAGREPRE